jgi:1-acyl-sn-glycerol-3-phosphate acyltransferase
MSLMRLSRSYPEIQNQEILDKFYKRGQPAMFVANHNSWMDIPFLGATIGWRNYKLISKKELGRVPILGTAIKVGGNIMVDRTDRRSQIKTLKDGISYLKVSRRNKQSGTIQLVGECVLSTEPAMYSYTLLPFSSTYRMVFTCAPSQKELALEPVT